MKTLTITIIILAIGFGAAYLFFPNDSHSTPTAAGEKQLYTCGMHPEIISEEPGYCPICAMKLTPKKDGGSRSGSIVIDATTRQNMGLATTIVDYRPISRAVRAFGKIDYREPNIYTVNLKIDGWIEKLFVDYEGQTVAKGEALLEIYSPQLVATQKEFLIAYNSLKKTNAGVGEMNALMESARMRLQNWDIPDDQVEKLIFDGQIFRTVVLRSPASGVVTVKNVSEGDHLKPGTQLYQIADLSSVWVVAYIYEHELPFVSLGQKADIKLPNLPDKKYQATISYISPFLKVRRQIEIRLDLENENYLLKPEMYAEVTLHSKLDLERLAIPRSAVINSGVRQLAYVAEGDGSFSSRLITTGIVGEDDYIEVRSGLNRNEQVVISGQFLLDSESRLEEALGGAHQHGGLHLAAVEENNYNDHGNEHSAKSTDKSSGIYTCPMPEHFHILQYGEGKCSECGMNLVPVEKTDNKNVYVCPMPEDKVVSSKPGDCPKCGMHLTQLHSETDHD